MVNFGPLVAEICWRVSKFQRVSRLGSVTAWHSSRGCQPNCGIEQRVPPVFGRAAITLGIGPHSSYLLILLVLRCTVILKIQTEACISYGQYSMIHSRQLLAEHIEEEVIV